MNEYKTIEDNICLNEAQRDTIKGIIYEHRKDLLIKVNKMIEDSFEDLSAEIDNKLQALTRYG